jgi:predicted membrane protein (TIGR00267 family)
VQYAYYAAIALAMMALFGLGIYLGRLSKRSLIMSGLRTAFAGVVCMGLSYLLERLTQ